MGKLIHSGFRLPAFVVAAMILLAGCGERAQNPSAPDIPRGYMPILDIEMNGHLLQFGPFAGYYFKPDSLDDLSRLSVLCFNEDFFYTRDMPENALLFKGDAILATLEPVAVPKTGDQRIIPVFFHRAPQAWLQSRPDPENEFINFHSCYDKSGPVLTGYWHRTPASGPKRLTPLQRGGCMGDGQHGWAAAEWIMMMRHLFIREEGQTLVIGEGIFPEWISQETRLSFGPTLVPGGRLKVNVSGPPDQLKLFLESKFHGPPLPCRIAVPGYKPVLSDTSVPTHILEALPNREDTG